MLRLTFFLLTLFAVNVTYSQVSKGKVKIDGKPENAIIKLQDSVINRGETYVWPQGIYKLQISAEGFDTYSNNYFQVYKDRLNSYNYKLKKYKEKQKLSKEVSLDLPKIIVPVALSGVAAIGLNYLLFPIEDQSASLDQIENYNSELQVIESANYPNWNMTVEEQQNYQEIKSNYLNEIEAYNEQVKKNNENRMNRVIFPAAIIGTASVVFFILEYRAYNKRKKALDLGFQPGQAKITYSF